MLWLVVVFVVGVVASIRCPNLALGRKTGANSSEKHNALEKHTEMVNTQSEEKCHVSRCLTLS